MENHKKLLIGVAVMMVMLAIIAGLFLLFNNKNGGNRQGPGKIIPRAQMQQTGQTPLTNKTPRPAQQTPVGY